MNAFASTHLSDDRLLAASFSTDGVNYTDRRPNARYTHCMNRMRIVALHGEYDLWRESSLEQQLREIEDFGAGTATIVDLSDVTFLDSTVLNALCRLRHRLIAEKPGASICLVAPRGHFAWRLFSITNLDRLFYIFEDVGFARRHVYGRYGFRQPATLSTVFDLNRARSPAHNVSKSATEMTLVRRSALSQGGDDGF